MKYKSKSSGEIKKEEDYAKNVLFTRDDFSEGDYVLQTVIIPSKTKQRSHYHKKQTEVFYIIKGSASIFMNNKEFPAAPGDSFICEPGDVHYVWNKTDEDFEVVVFKINLPEENDTVWVDK